MIPNLATEPSGVSGPTSSATTSRRSSGTRSSVLGSTCAIPSICTVGKTICSGAGIRPIRSSPWRWPLTPSRQAASPATTASPSDGGRPGGRHRVAVAGSRPLARHAASAARSLAWHHAHRSGARHRHRHDARDGPCREAAGATSTGRLRAPYIPLACRAHQSECRRTPLARGRHHKEGPSP